MKIKTLAISFGAIIYILFLTFLRPAADVLGVTSSNVPPSSGYSRQLVDTGSGKFYVRIIAAD